MSTSAGCAASPIQRAAISYQGLQRIETYPVPEPALREAVLNALIHKDYTSGVPIQISVYSNQLLIWNPGQLPPDWTVRKLKSKHSSQPYNPAIANLFFRAGEIEAWGRGIEHIYAACREAGAPEPEIEYEQTGLWMKFFFAPELVEQNAKAEGVSETPVETRAKTPDLVLAALAATPEQTLAQVALSIGKSLSAVERVAAKLVKEHKLRFIGPKKGGRWEVR